MMGGSLIQLLRGEFWLKPRAKSNRENLFIKEKITMIWCSSCLLRHIDFFEHFFL